MLRALIVAAAIAAFPAVAAAEQYDCASAVGEPPVTLKIDTEYSGGAYAVMRASFQIEGDILHATEAGQPEAAVEVSDVVIAQDTLRLTLHYIDPEFGESLAIAHLVTIGDFGTPVTAGGLATSAGGLWTMSCVVGYAG